VDVQFSLLGPVRAWCGPAEVDLGPNQQRATLALLLVRANQFVTTDDLSELLWERNPPGSAINAIHKYIGAIRRLLEPNLEARTSGRWLTRQGGAYRLAADEGTSDLIAFRRMVKDARSAHAGDRPADALDLLMEALGLRRGACGEGLEPYRRHRDYFAAVDQEYAAAIAEAADAALACAQPLRILPLLRQIASDDPLNESLQARLMLLLAATGQQALALSHYQEMFGGHLPSPAELLQADPAGLRQAGLSRRKISTLRDLAERLTDGRLNVDALSARPDEQIIAELTEVPGIGPWTVQGALILGLNREDVVLPGDLALRKAVRDAYQLDHLPTSDEILAIAERWRPYRSLATLYLFRAGESTAAVNGNVPALDDANNVTEVG
jgi:DNA-binding SARP family transcriptional activator